MTVFPTMRTRRERKEERGAADLRCGRVVVDARSVGSPYHNHTLLLIWYSLLRFECLLVLLKKSLGMFWEMVLVVGG